MRIVLGCSSLARPVFEGQAGNIRKIGRVRRNEDAPGRDRMSGDPASEVAPARPADLPSDRSVGLGRGTVERENDDGPQDRLESRLAKAPKPGRFGKAALKFSVARRRRRHGAIVPFPPLKHRLKPIAQMDRDVGVEQEQSTSVPFAIGNVEVLEPRPRPALATRAILRPSRLGSDAPGASRPCRPDA